ncbi:hypothetical protein [Devosia sp. SD17-2]|uniref:hypothetical protein n=1 Tax=Devosia sp. SD17-2 TaxID=2976459 RepID=UPI0023D819D6|nr:hypothetical protein [Devosia sp. SD17-2]WEJ33768.1 hypothetical protein NYQ88_02765 [Devosia sp. SD17-2]
MPLARLASFIAFGTVILSSPALAQATDEQNVFVMGGPFTSGYFSDAFLLWEDHYESNFFAGVGYQYFMYEHSGGFKLGAEAGLGVRLGDRSSAELWAGLVGRLDMFQIGDIRITPSITAGFSVVTDTIGVETERAAKLGHDIPFLYYLGPEIAVSHVGYPELEAFGRIHHRSGGFGTIAEIDGSNAVVMGLRYKF